MTNICSRLKQLTLLLSARFLADKPKLEQMIFGHPAENNPYANKLEEQAKEVVPGIEDFTREFMDDLLQISRVILRGLALALGVPEDFFVAVSGVNQSDSNI